MPPTPPRTAWLAGVVLGVLDGFLLFEFPLLGLVLTLIAALLLGRERPRSAGIGGLLVGIGGCWTFFLTRAKLACLAFDAAPNQGCEMPTVEGYLVAAGLVLLVGIGLTLRLALRRRRP